MKSVLVAAILLASTQSFAGIACNVSYAAGLGHVFKGMGRPLGDQEKILPGQIVKDEFYTVKLSKKDGTLALKETKSGKLVEFIAENQDGFTIYATKSLQGKPYPDGVPGAFGGRQFIIGLCADESAF